MNGLIHIKNNNKNILYIMSKKLIIHISGFSGSGNTTLGNKLKDKYGDKIMVKDLDDLYYEFINQNIIFDYQKFINNFIMKYYKIPLIIIGLSANKCLGNMNSNKFYKINTHHKYFIKNDKNNILKQRFFRQISKLNDRKELLFDNWLKNNDEIQNKLFRYINLIKWKSNNILYNEKQKYKLMDKNNIYKDICDLIDNIYN